MNKVAFVKMHGLGNDFVIINLNEVNNNPVQFISSIIDRHTGLGCDQLIFYRNISENLYEMQVYNHDGSKAKACGNASRCLTKIILENNNSNEIFIQTSMRLIKGQKQGNLYKVCMGEVSFDEKWMPSSDDLSKFAMQYNIDIKDLICADIGNPHLVIFSSLAHNDRALIGELLQINPIFPEGVNVNFAEINGEEINLQVWERGVGFTLACGSGGAATYAAALKEGYLQNDAAVCFELGKLYMHVENNKIFMTGPATLIARGGYFYG